MSSKEDVLDLRIATESDRTYIARLNFLTETFGDEHGTIGEDFEEEFVYYVQGWQPEQGAVIAWRGAIPAGGAWLRPGTDDRHGFGHVREGIPEVAIAVEERYKGQGLGTALLNRATELAGELGYAGISLSVHPDNARAHRLYLHLGFQDTGIVREGHAVLVKEF
ncbi:GNAT family N-acetyltransferase [Corynebacterium epidermidicanis]|uniref:Acetyltransferase n=1 Tax=Corynebacterium epidermidicanis TaxID=1050174 RepID=A0A0G3GNK5_9CORY|nr:GNAT family N-acetyltransferase [Corynebacterium epidermidicanis]AKK02120.1 acetyltransferase [Corynebacterium epidermidicanis]